MLTKLNSLKFSSFLLKMRMLSDVASQKIVTDVGDRFNLLKLGLYPAPKEDDQSGESAHSFENIELVMIKARSNSRRHFHKHSDAVVYIVSGRGKLLLGDEAIAYQPNMKIAIPQRTMHGFATDTKTVFLSIQNPHIIDPLTGKVDIHYESAGL